MLLSTLEGANATVLGLDSLYPKSPITQTPGFGAGHFAWSPTRQNIQHLKTPDPRCVTPWCVLLCFLSVQVSSKPCGGSGSLARHNPGWLRGGTWLFPQGSSTLHRGVGFI